ncbi:hypothetical protein EC991_004981 [Linnemannia zychae]|nr:hypothetical protein EC991_004981 [Linnemannia zychae]
MESPVPDTVIQMCRPCRIEYYAKHPEPIPSRLLPFFWGENDSYKVISRIDVLTAMIFVPLRSSSLVPGQNGSRSLFQESDILQLARQTRGGDVGIASYKSASKRTCWVFSDLKDDAVKRRQVLLRSLLYDKRLPLRPRSNVCNMFVQSGHGDPVEIVKELDVEDWLKCCTNYNSAIKEVTHQIRLRPNGHNSARQASFQKKSKGQPNDDAEEDKEWHKLVELDRWLMRRLYNANFHSYKLDPEGPMKPPEAIWPMLDSLDMGQNALDYAAHTVARSLRKEKSRKIDYELGLGFEDMDELDMSVDQVRKIIDDTTTTMTADQSSENEGPVRTLSMLLEDELGLSWDRLVVQRVKNLLQSIGTSV